MGWLTLNHPDSLQSFLIQINTPIINKRLHVCMNKHQTEWGERLPSGAFSFANSFSVKNIASRTALIISSVVKDVLKAKKLIREDHMRKGISSSKRSYLLTLRKILPDKNSAAQLPLWPSNTPILCKEIRRPWISRLGRNSQNTIAAASGHHSESNGDLGSRWRADRRCPVGYASWAQKAATPAASWVRPKQLNGREMVLVRNAWARFGKHPQGAFFCGHLL